VRNANAIFGLSFLLLIGAMVQSASAQDGERLRAWQQRRAAAQQGRPNGGKKGEPNARAMEGLPPKWIEKLRDMPPEQQQRFMENNEQFQKLPPERQQQIRQN